VIFVKLHQITMPF